MRTQAEQNLLTAIRGLLSATLKGWPPEERGTLERALIAYEKEPTPVQRVLALLKLPEGHMGNIEDRISSLLRAEVCLTALVMILRRAGYKGFSVVEGAQWAAAEIKRLTPKVAPPSRGRVERKPAAKQRRARA
jgi:hypothetical protein